MNQLPWSSPIAIASFLLTTTFALLPTSVSAQISATPDGTSTTINQTGNTFNITNGTQAGSNLFHSFQQFGLNQGQIANFLSSPAIQNILGRVTGGEASVINGLIQVTGSNANLYLMNPAGIVFGANASLNVPGSFTATTANGIGIGNNWFNAIGTNNYASLSGTPNRLAFTMSSPGAIVNAANLAVAEGSKLVLVGGTVVSTGELIATRGQVVIATVPGSRLVQITEVGRLLQLEIQPLNVSATQPLPWSQNIASLPALLTGGTLGNATELTVNSDGSVSLVGSGLRVDPGDIVVTQPIAGIFGADGTYARLDPLGVTLNSSGKIITENLAVIAAEENPTIDLSATGNIQTGKINFAGVFSNEPASGIYKGVKLFSETGNITVETISTTIGDIDVTAAGLFQATGFLGEAPASGIFNPQQVDTLRYGYSTNLRNYVEQDPQVVKFFADKTGLTEAELSNSLAFIFSRVTVPLPVSVSAFFGNISIRYGGGSSLQFRARDANLSGSTITATGNAPFVVGPNVISNPGDPFFPRNPSDNFADFGIRPFNIIKNESYSLLTIPDGVSGTRGAIVRGVTTDGSFYSSMQNRVFGILPVSPCPSCGLPLEVRGDSSRTNPSAGTSLGTPLTTLRPEIQVSNEAQVIQQQANQRQQTVDCHSSTTIAAATVSETRSSSGSSNPCASTDGGNEQILKILGEDRKPNSSN